jgi:ABC-type amino acid transport substrate-binding protein
MTHRSIGAFLLLAWAIAAPARAADPFSLRLPGVLRVLASADEMPEVFSFEVRPAQAGYERELVEGFTRAHKLELRIVPVRNFDQIIPMLVKGDGDLIVGIVDTPARREKIRFTSETYPVRHMVVTRKPQAAVAAADQLKPLRVAVIPGTTWADATTEAGVPSHQQVPVADTREALEALRSGRAQATVMAVFDFTLARKHDPALEAGTFLGRPGVAAWGVRKEDGALLRAIDDYLFALRMSPSRSALLVKYFSDDALVLLKRARQE